CRTVIAARFCTPERGAKAPSESAWGWGPTRRERCRHSPQITREFEHVKIRILVTGGTFDKEYDELTGRLYFLDTHVPEMLRRGRCRLDLALETVMMIDSLEMDERGRAAIVARPRDCAERAGVVTPGTATRGPTAEALT